MHAYSEQRAKIPQCMSVIEIIEMLKALFDDIPFKI